MIEHHLDDVGIERLFRVVDRVACRCDRGIGVRAQLLGDFADQRGFEQRLVALDVDHDRLVFELQLRGSLREPVGAGRVVGAREHSIDPVLRRGHANALVVGRHHDPVRAAGTRPLRDANDHRLAHDVE